MAQNLGVAYSTFRTYKEKYPALSAVLTRTRAYVDNVTVVGAMLKRAIGYTAVEIREEYEYEQDKKTGKRKKVKVREVHQEKHVPGDPRLLELWLKIRMPDVWNRVKDDTEDEVQENQVILLPVDDIIDEETEEEIAEAADE